MAKAVPVLPNAAARVEAPPSYRTFSSRPGKYIIDEFLSHVRETDSPETFAGLYTAPLGHGEPFEKLKDFEVNRKKRPDRDMAPCPMCHSPNKYLNGELVYLPRLKALAAIGHECADPKNREIATREYRERSVRDCEEGFLLAELPLVQRRLVVAHRLRNAASAILLLYRTIRRKASTMQHQLRQVKNQGGRLTVMEKVGDDIAAIGPDGFGRSRGLNAREVSFGQLNGSILATSNYNPAAELSRVIDKLQPYGSAVSEEAALDLIVGWSAADRHRAYADTRYAGAQFKKCAARMREFVEFFEPDNIRRIAKWAAHPDHPRPFRIKRIEKDGVSKLILRNDEEHLVVDIDPNITPPRLNWPRVENLQT